METVRNWRNEVFSTSDREVFRILDPILPKRNAATEIKTHNKKVRLTIPTSEKEKLSDLSVVIFKLVHFPIESRKDMNKKLLKIPQRFQPIEPSLINVTRMVEQLYNDIKTIQYNMINGYVVSNQDISKLLSYVNISRFIDGLYCERVNSLNDLIEHKVSKKFERDTNNILKVFRTEKNFYDSNKIIINPNFSTGITPPAQGSFILDNTLYEISFDKINKYDKELLRKLMGYVLFQIIQQTHPDKRHNYPEMNDLTHIEKVAIYNPRDNKIIMYDLPPNFYLVDAAHKIRELYEKKYEKYKGLY